MWLVDAHLLTESQSRKQIWLWWRMPQISNENATFGGLSNVRVFRLSVTFLNSHTHTHTEERRVSFTIEIAYSRAKKFQKQINSNIGTYFFFKCTLTLSVTVEFPPSEFFGWIKEYFALYFCIMCARIYRTQKLKCSRKTPQLNHIMNKKQSGEMISFITVTARFVSSNFLTTMNGYNSHERTRQALNAELTDWKREPSEEKEKPYTEKH